MTSLKQKLNNWIRRDGYVRYEAIKFACENGELGRYYRISTAERRLRNESPDVEADMGDKNYIKGYRYIGIPPKTTTYNVLGNNQEVLKSFQIKD